MKQGKTLGFSRTAFWIVVGAAALLATTWTVTAERIGFELEQSEEEAFRTNANLAVAYEEQTIGTLRNIEQVLKMVRFEHRREGANFDIERFLATTGLDTAVFNIIAVIDEHGHRVLGHVDPLGLNLTDREYFTAHARGQGDQLFIAQPALGRATGKWTLHMSLRIDKPDGTFGGVVMGAVDPEYFSRFYDKADLGTEGLVALIGSDGIVRAQRSGDQRTYGLDKRGSTYFAEQARRPTGRFMSLGKSTGTPRFVSYRGLARYPLTVVVATSRGQVLGPFHQREQYYYLTAASRSLLIVVCAAGLLYMLSRQRRAMRSLAASQTRYRDIFENAAEGIFQTTPQGGFITANPAMARILGYDSADDLVRHRTDIAREGYVSPEQREAFKRIIERDGAVKGFEYEARRKDGTTTWVSETARGMRDGGGRILYYEGILEDIGARRQAEERLAVLAQRLASANDLAGVFRTLLHFVKESVSCTAFHVSVYDERRRERTRAYAWEDGREQPVAGLPPLACPDGDATLRGQIVSIAGPPAEIVVPMTIMGRVIGALEIRGGPTETFVPERMTALRMAAMLAGMATENVRLLEEERALRHKAEDSERGTAAIIESALDAVVKIDTGGAIVEFNPAAERMFGHARRDVVGLPMAELLVPAARRKEHEAGFARHLATGEGKMLGRRVETSALRADGSEFPVELAISRVDTNPPTFTSFIRDITERRETHERLVRSDAFLGIVEHAARLGGWRVPLPDGSVVWSDQACRIREVEPGTTMTPDEVFATYAPEFRERARLLAHRCSTEGTPFDEELQIVTCVTGRRLWVRMIGQAVRDSGGRIVGLQGAMQDIDARKEAEGRVRQVTQELATTLESITDAFFTVDREWRLTYLNGETERVWQRSRSEMLGKVVWDEMPHTRDTLFEKEMRRAVEQNCTVAFEAHYAPLDVWADVRAYPSGDGLAVYFRDITEAKRAEERRESLEGQLREAQKMEAIGQLAGGVAHDFNNIVAAILGNLELARQESAGNTLALESLDEIRKAGHRARDLIGQILSFSRRQPVARRLVELVPLVEESVRLLRATMPGRVRVNFTATHAPSVQADPTQIGQVVLNLGTNSLHAMNGLAGTIDIRVDTVSFGESSPANPRPHSLAPGAYARIAIADTGQGMGEATLGRIYEPFFTTKPVGEGTGLGLPVVHGIVKSHLGAINVTSAVGKGTTFEIYLPLAQAALETARPALESPAAGPVQGNGERILYLDDDEAQVFLVKRMLERRGYRVSGFLNQREAIESLRAEPEDFALVVTDYNMPGMSGLDVARVVRGIRPELPVAIASGYITQELSEEAAGAGVREVIFKPNVVRDFIDVVQRLVPTARA